MSMIRKFHDALIGPVKHVGDEALQKAGVSKPSRSAIGGAVQAGLSGSIVGGTLGMIAGQRVGGLDAPVGPLDAWAGAAGLAASVALAGHGDGLDDLARDAGGQAMAVFSFRKAQDFFAAKKAAAAHGDGQGGGLDYSASGGGSALNNAGSMAGEDPVVAAARKL